MYAYDGIRYYSENNLFILLLAFFAGEFLVAF